jgi:hypothetical protein
MVGGTVDAHSSNWRGGEGRCEQTMGGFARRGSKLNDRHRVRFHASLKAAAKDEGAACCRGDELRPDSKVQHSCASFIRPSPASKLRVPSKLQIFALLSSFLHHRQHYKTLLNGRLDIPMTSLFSRCA